MTHWICLPSAQKWTPSHGYSSWWGSSARHTRMVPPVWFHLARFLILIISLPGKTVSFNIVFGTKLHNNARILEEVTWFCELELKLQISRLHLCCHCSLASGTAWMQCQGSSETKTCHKTCSIQSLDSFMLRCIMFLSDSVLGCHFHSSPSCSSGLESSVLQFQFNPSWFIWGLLWSFFSLGLAWARYARRRAFQWSRFLELQYQSLSVCACVCMCVGLCACVCVCVCVCVRACKHCKVDSRFILCSDHGKMWQASSGLLKIVLHPSSTKVPCAPSPRTEWVLNHPQATPATNVPH